MDKRKTIAFYMNFKGGVEGQKFKAKDSEKIRGKDKGLIFWGQTLSRPKARRLEAKTKDTIFLKIMVGKFSEFLFFYRESV